MTKLENYLIELKTHEGKPDINEIQLELTTEDLRFALSTIKVCSQRTNTDIDDQEPLVELYKKLKTIINENPTDNNKSIENGSVNSSIEEVQ
jgi:hypothetical protein